MNETTGQFRSAAFGGFHRQDVLDYIETITRENEARREELEQALAREREARAQAEARLETAEDQAAQAASERDRLAEELARTKEALDQTAAALTQARSQAEDLESKVSHLAPEAESWQRIKDTAGDIEVSAHERAQITLQCARAQAAEIRADGVRWVLDIQNRCDRLKRDLANSILSAETELDTVRAAFSRAQEDMEGIQDALSDLVAGASEEEN